MHLRKSTLTPLGWSCDQCMDVDVMGAGRYRLKRSGATCMAEADKQKGRIFLHRGDLAQARVCYEQALKDDRQDDSPQALSDTLGNLGNICAMLGDYQEAERCY